MVLAFAMALAGVNPSDFDGLIRKLTPQHKLMGAIERPSSPSARSESSGIGTIAPSVRSNEDMSPWMTPMSSRAPSVRSNDDNTPSLSPISSRPGTPTDEIMKNEEETHNLLPEEPKKRSVFDLAANITDPSWQMVHPELPFNDSHSYFSKEPVYQSFNEENPTTNYPMRCCSDCQFNEPSPYLFGDPYIPPKHKRLNDNSTSR